jgi:Protein of unknown function (DUF3048) N-terminal domain/Protein of unknown function (DUF3048) C-terminal domain
MPDPTGQSLTRPALWVKVENTPEARPQSGLNQADVVFEQVTEGGITRFVTLFNSDLPDVVGPIRSTRAMDSDVAGPLGGVFAYSGGIPQSVQLITHAPVAAVDETAAGKAMFRDRAKKAPHNLFAHASDLLQFGSGQPVPPPALFQYLPAGQAFNGDAVASFTVDFDPPYRPTYTYDAANNVWTRAIGSTPFVDASGQQIAPTNVVVQFVPCCLDVPEGGTYITIGSGEAWVFSGGKMVKGTWSRSDRSQLTSFVDANNQPIHLAPGRTWVEFVPNGGNVDVTAAAPASPASSPP